MKGKILLMLVISFSTFQTTCFAQNENVDSLKVVTLIGNLVRKELVRIDSTKLDSLSQHEISELRIEVNKQHKASNILVKLTDLDDREIATAVSDANGQYVIKSKIPHKSTYYLNIYGDGADQPKTRQKIIYVGGFEKGFLPKYFIKDY